MKVSPAAVLAAVLFSSLHGVCRGDGLKIQPAEVVRSLDDRGETLNFIVRGTPTGLEAARRSVPASTGKPETLPFIDGLGLSMKMKQAEALARRSDIRQIWFINGELYPTYVRIIKGIEHATKTISPSSVINLSLGPPADLLPLAGHDEEPMNEATKKAAELGFVVIIAIGNYYDGQDAGLVNPWCHPLWVVCVGAASADAKSVWSGSARGVDTDARTWPDVVANGIDVISDWPTSLQKSESRRQRDEANPQFRASIPKEKWGLYTMESGTSQAAPQVTKAAAHIITFVRKLMETQPGLKPGDKLFSIQVPADRFNSTSRRGPRLTGEVEANTDSTQFEITYCVDQPWKMVKQLLLDTAVPMADYPPSAVGAGFVDPGYVKQQFPTPQDDVIQVEPIKVL